MLNMYYFVIGINISKIISNILNKRNNFLVTIIELLGFLNHTLLYTRLQESHAEFEFKSYPLGFMFHQIIQLYIYFLDPKPTSLGCTPLIRTEVAMILKVSIQNKVKPITMHITQCVPSLPPIMKPSKTFIIGRTFNFKLIVFGWWLMMCIKQR